MITVNFSPSVLAFYNGCSQVALPKEIICTNDSGQPVRLDVTAYSGSVFRVNAHSIRVEDKASASIMIYPGSSTSVNAERLSIQVTGLQLFDSKTIEVPIVRVDAVQSGSLAVVMNPNPPGNDLLPEGEYLDIINISTSSLYVNDLTIQHRVFPSRNLRDLVKLKNVPLLPPGMTLRIYTRSKDTAWDLGNDFDSTRGYWRYFCNNNVAVWNNNENDTAIILNQCGNTIVNYTYQPTVSNPPTIPSPQSQLLSSRFVRVEASRWNRVLTNVLEGDIIRVSGSGGAISWFSLFNFGRMRLADGREVSNNATRTASAQPGHNGRFFPMPGANEGSLIGAFNHANSNSTPAFADNDSPTAANDFNMKDIGLRDTTINVPDRIVKVTGSTLVPPYDFYLGVNDEWLDDNSGFFFCFVEHFR